MPKKKESVWTMGNKGPTGPWVWHAWVKGSKKPVRVVAFDIDHISCQLEGKQVIKAKKLPEEKDRLLEAVDQALTWDLSHFRSHFIGTQ